MTKKVFSISLSFFTLSVLYFISRLINLTSIPVFGDEAIYIRWSQIIQTEETLRFIPLTDGKQPLFMWIVAVFLKFIKDPLIAGRFVSVLSGFGNLFILFLLTPILINPNKSIKDPLKHTFDSILKYYPSGIISAVIYITLPFTLFFDRLSTADNLLAFFGLSSFLLSFLLAKFPRLDLSLILGFILGLAWLTKSPAIYFVVLSLLTFTIYNYQKIYLLFYPLISVFIAILIYNILRLGPQFHMIALRNRDYIWTLKDILKNPLDPFIPHLIDIYHIFVLYISVPVLILIIFTKIYLIFIRPKKLITLPVFITILWFILPLIANAAFAKVFTARYFLFTIMPFILALSYLLFQFLNQFKLNKVLLAFLTIIFIIPNLFTIYSLSTTPFNVKLPPTENGYLNNWTSGWGIKSASKYLIDRSKTFNVIVGTEGYFGTLPDGLQIYTQNIPRLTVFGVGINITEIPAKLIEARDYGDDVYLLFNQSRLKLSSDQYQNLTLIMSTDKPDGDKLVLYRLN